MEIRVPHGGKWDIDLVIENATARVSGIRLGDDIVYAYGKGRVVSTDRASRVRLYPVGDRYRSYRRGRRVHAVCWHGHRDWMRAVFAQCPDALIATQLITYLNAADFEDRHRDTLPATLNCRCSYEALAA